MNDFMSSDNLKVPNVNYVNTSNIKSEHFMAGDLDK